MSDPLRVLVITPDFPPAMGGIQSLVSNLVLNLRSVAVRVVALDSLGSGAWDAAHGLDVRRVPAGRDRRLANLRLNAVALAEARRWGPDVVLAAHIVASPASAALRRFGMPGIVYLHAKELPASPRLARFAVRQSDAVIAVSRYTAGLAEAAGADPRKVVRIPPGVPQVKPGPALPARERPTVVTVARLEDRYKGHDVLLRALPRIRERVPGVEWVVIGNGPLRAELETSARAGGLDAAVRFCGRVSDEERDRWLRTAHVLAMPSRLPGPGAAGEGFGIVFLEAAAHGLPVVAGDVGGALDAVSDGVSGLLVDPTSAPAVADAIAGLLLDPVRRGEMAAAARHHAASFAWPSIAGRVEALLRDVSVLASGRGDGVRERSPQTDPR